MLDAISCHSLSIKINKMGKEVSIHYLFSPILKMENY